MAVLIDIPENPNCSEWAGQVFQPRTAPRPVSHVRRRHGPGVARLVTTSAATPVRSEALEKRTGEIHFPSRTECFNNPSRILKGFEVGEKPTIGHNH